MKLNNKGFGMKETLIYLAVLLLMLLIASCSISSFYDGLESSKNREKDNYVETDDDNVVIVDGDDDDIIIDYKHYYKAESKFELAVKDYALDHGFGTTLNTVTLDEVVKDGYLDSPIVDYVDGSKCTGYANVTYANADYQASVYLLCTNYKTEGYR